MINRTQVRTQVVQTLFAHNYTEGKTFLSSKKDLLNGFSDTYSLYMMMLDFINEMVCAAEEQIENDTQRAQVCHEEYIPNTNFVNNRIATQIFNNRQLRAYMDENRLCWDAAHESLRILWKQITEADCYKEHMALEHPTYDDDKVVLRKIMSDVLADNDDLCAALEELEVSLDKRNWTTDINVVLSYVIKTIKRFKQEKGAEQELLEMFDNEEELNFAKNLLKAAIDNHDEYMKLVEEHLNNWDISRVAYMDQIILQVALAEILNFPNIPLEISINEYLEIAKEYSTDKSHKFINGLLDVIVKDLKDQNRLIKAVVID